MTLHLHDSPRRIDIADVEIKGLFLVKEAYAQGRRTLTARLVLEQLARSKNAAIANQARMLMVKP